MQYLTRREALKTLLVAAGTIGAAAVTLRWLRPP
ncbi:MAG: twin-arginine translocation signal domain-containing protein [Dehalococcoidia bacterium]|nr:twin-arginine translocation signal domain-containing protein [Dehalococcoidia bacterium]